MSGTSLLYMGAGVGVSATLYATDVATPLQALCGLAGVALLAILKTRVALSRRRQRNAAYCKENDTRVLIIGTGLNGLAAAIRMKKLNIPFTMIEKGHDAGGTWLYNTYPGCQCDVMSFLYSLSEYPMPKGGWKRTFSFQPDILAYVNEVVAHFGLREHIVFNTRVESCTWDAEKSVYKVKSSHVSTGEKSVENFAVVIAASGPLHVPMYPKCEGREDGVFEGKQMHTANWDSHVNLEGKRVVIVGSAASAVQAVPLVAKTAGHLTVIQRTPNWVTAKSDFECGTLTRFFLRYVPGAVAAARLGVFLRNEVIFHLMFHPDSWFAKKVQAMTASAIRKAVPRYAATDDLVPSYQMGCKRILMSNDYYRSLRRESVDVLSRQGVQRLTKTGIVSRDNETGVETETTADVVIWATGFDVRGLAFNVRGGQGMSLVEHMMKNGPQAYLGAAYPNFPNFYSVLGPNTGLGHSSVLIMGEAQLEVIDQCLDRLMAEPSVASVEVSSSCAAAYTTWLDGRFASSIWKSGCSSWYMNKLGKVDALFPGSAWEFLSLCERSLDFSKDFVIGTRQ